MSRPQFDKDIELAKISLVAEEWRGNKLMYLGTLLSALIAVLVLGSAAESSKQISFLAFIVVIVVELAFFVSYGYFTQLRPYEKRIRFLDTLLKKVNAGESIGSIEELLKKKITLN